uniref:Uncharacterized protein n=1 Tax=Anguilla anguilla TaxID=7936 RepID=A0A0E9W956_ANGAN
MKGKNTQFKLAHGESPPLPPPQARSTFTCLM